jgi:hypothetical protein
VESGSQEREVRAARNQALFRAVNDKLETLNDAFEQMTDSLTIACECADVNCLEMLDIKPDDYRAVRAEPRRFVVVPGHVDPDIETTVGESNGYLVVEKTGTAGDLAEVFERDGTPTSQDRKQR